MSERKGSTLHGKSRRLAVGIDAYLADLVFDRHHGETIHGGGVQVLLHVVGRHLRDLAGDFLLLLLGEGIVFYLLAPLLAELVDGLVEVFLHAFVAAEGRAHLVHLLGQLGLDHFLVDGQGVEPGLHEEEFALHHVLKELAADVAVGRIAAGVHHLDFLLDFGEGDEFAADHGHGLVHDAAVFLRGRRHAEGQQRRGKDYCSFNFHMDPQVAKLVPQLFPAGKMLLPCPC